MYHKALIIFLFSESSISFILMVKIALPPSHQVIKEEWKQHKKVANFSIICSVSCFIREETWLECLDKKSEYCILFILGYIHVSLILGYHVLINFYCQKKGAQWLSGRVLDLRPKGQGLSLTCVTVLCPWARTLILA